ncbi:copper resistance protein CopC [Sphaerisporangium sp. NPDC051017]|uniref:copper resistance CopC family protein n=1 Tax=Sphaerisporangium sp. NPDC051017 TaxID=3154636 RepID=UPI003414A61B
MEEKQWETSSSADRRFRGISGLFPALPARFTRFTRFTGFTFRAARPARAWAATARWTARVVMLALVGGLALTAVTPPASAHGQLAMSNPANDGTISSPIEAVELYFTEAPISYAYFTVKAPSGVRVDKPWAQGPPKRLDEPVREYHLINGTWEPKLYHEGFPAKLPVAYWPDKGVYVATYRTIASDGEEVRGEVKFTYNGKTTEAPKGWRTPTNSPDPAFEAAAGRTSAPQVGETPSDMPSPVAAAGPTPQTSCTPRTMPETGCTPGDASQAPSAEAASSAASSQDGGVDLLVWLLPALLVVGVGVMVVRAARRPAPGGATARGGQNRKDTRGGQNRKNPSGGQNRKNTPPSARRGPAARPAPKAKSAKRR